MAEEIRMREFAPEMNAIRQRFDAECPQLAELLERLLNKVNPKSVEEINTTVQNIISGAQVIGGGDGTLVDFLINGVFKTTGRRVNIESKSPNLQLTAPLIVGNLMDYFFMLKPGGEIAPFSKLFEWNRRTTGQFGAVSHSPVPPVGSGFFLNFVDDTPPTTGLWVAPYIDFKNTNAGGDWTGVGWVHTVVNISAKAGQNLLVIADFGTVAVAGTPDPLGKVGLCISKSATPTQDYYLFGFSQTNMRLSKYVGGTGATEAGDPAFSVPASGAQQKSRVHIILTPSGDANHPHKCRVSVGGGASGFQTEVFDHRMTVSNSTIITAQSSIKLGFRQERVSGGGGNALVCTRLLAYSIPDEEQFLP